VLVIDDEPDAAEALTLALRMRGLSVRVAFDAESALEDIAARRPRVIVSDLSMPGMSGLDLLQHVRRDELECGLARVRAIAISGRGSPTDRRRVRRAGFDAFMPKPVDVRLLFQWIQNALVESADPGGASLSVMVLGPNGGVAELLRGAGHEVCVAEGLDRAVEIGTRTRLNAMVVDLDAVGDDTSRLVRQLRDDRLSLFVIGLTSAPVEASDEETFDFVLEKPLRFEELALALHRANPA
jgi:CheY-like chemotaxis protein